MVTVRIRSKLKTSWKSVVSTNIVGKNSRYFVDVFNKTIIPLRATRLVGFHPSHIQHFNAGGIIIIVLLKTPTKYREFLPTLLVKTTDFQLVFNIKQMRTVTIFGEHSIMAQIPWWLSSRIALSTDSVFDDVNCARFRFICLFTTSRGISAS